MKVSIGHTGAQHSPHLDIPVPSDEDVVAVHIVVDGVDADEEAHSQSDFRQQQAYCAPGELLPFPAESFDHLPQVTGRNWHGNSLHTHYVAAWPWVDCLK